MQDKDCSLIQINQSSAASDVQTCHFSQSNDSEMWEIFSAA